MPKIRWGVLGTAHIALQQVIPAMQQGSASEVIGLASRTLDKARDAARRLGLRKAYGSYEALLADPAVDAVYVPLANHLHVPWSVAALEAGKHVLCEKPIGLSSGEAETLVRAAAGHPRLKLMEAFMYRHHPQWVIAKRMVDEGRLGELRAVHTLFSYDDRDPQSICNRPEVGGGALLDIGCYGVSVPRFLFGAEPTRVRAEIEFDPQFRVDRLTSALVRFERGQAHFTVGTQLAPCQRVQILGTLGRLAVEIPFNAPTDRPCRLWFHQGETAEEILVPTCNQYTIQGDLFSRSILDDTPVPTPIEDAVANMRVIDAIFRSASGNA